MLWCELAPLEGREKSAVSQINIRKIQKFEIEIEKKINRNKKNKIGEPKIQHSLLSLCVKLMISFRLKLNLCIYLSINLNTSHFAVVFCVKKISMVVLNHPPC